MALIWDAFLEDYEEEIDVSLWSKRDTLEVFWHYSQGERKEVEKLILEKRKRIEKRYECFECNSKGFNPSITGVGCSFCDGTEGGNPPEKEEDQ